MTNTKLFESHISQKKVLNTDIHGYPTSTAFEKVAKYIMSMIELPFCEKLEQRNQRNVEGNRKGRK